ncbi:MAG: glucose-6-phosphate isomerase, partial [Tannerellaceae bacterium]|nr:glucose-6-phosphate isomerase [Tannerellaceae bacterium]
MTGITLDISKAFDFVSKEEIYAFENKTKTALDALHNATGKGNDFLGWLSLPSSITDKEVAGILDIAGGLRSKCEVVVVVGIGGSYLGAKATLEAINGSFDHLQSSRQAPLILYAGHHISEDYLSELCVALENRSFGLINISKSGTTTEPALAFRILRKQLEDALGKEEARSRIVAVTDAHKGALRQLANKEGYRTLVIPGDVGGRFSVLTPVGLLPLAVAGIDIRDLIAGAAKMEVETGADIPFAR